jgi:hypothetical protein
LPCSMRPYCFRRRCQRLGCAKGSCTSEIAVLALMIKHDLTEGPDMFGSYIHIV